MVKNLQAAGQQGFITVYMPHKVVNIGKNSQLLEKAVILYNFGIRDKFFFSFLVVYLHPVSCILFQVTEK